MGGIGTNHGAASAIVCSMLKPPLKCEIFLFPQPLTWHVQRSLLLFDYFGAKLHLGENRWDIQMKVQKVFPFQLLRDFYFHID